MRKLAAALVVVACSCAGRTPPLEDTREPLVLFAPSAAPPATNIDIGYDVELGVELWSDVGGTVNGVRFYKGSADVGTHIGHLWRKDDQALLATALFTGETATGWQEAQLVPAVSIPAHEHVIVSYHTTTGFSYTQGGYQNAVDAPPLHVPASGGVYAFGPSTDPQRPPLYPSSTYMSSSYWVDVDFRASPSETDASHTLFDASLTPPTEIPSTTSYELGFRWHSDADGAVRGVRFYKTPNDTGSHTVHVWDTSGNLLAAAGSQEESPAGWQEVPIAVPISAGQTYVASYSTSTSFPADSTEFASAVDRPPLHAAATAGAFGPAGSFPTQTLGTTGYLVDVDFEMNACAPSCSACGQDDGCGHVCCGSARDSLWAVGEGPEAPGYQGVASFELGTRFTVSTPGLARAIRYYKDPSMAAATVGHVWRSDGSLVATATFAPGTTRGWQEAPLGDAYELDPGTEYTVSYQTTNGFAYSPDYFDRFGHGQSPLTAPVGAGVYGPPGSRPTQTYVGSSYWADLVFQPYPGTQTLFPSWLLPAEAQNASSTPFELGVRFVTQGYGYVTQIRFYKGAGNDGPHVGHLWDKSGNLLQAVPFTNETASGWQSATLPSPQFIGPGDTFTVSISTQTGFAWTTDFFDHAYVGGAATVPAAGGVWAAAGSFPTQTYVNSSYWVDLTFEPWMPACAPHCAGLSCGDIDPFCGTICCSGSGCTPAQGCDATCQTVEGCGGACEPVAGPTCPRTLPAARPLGFNLPFLLDYYFTPSPLSSDEARREMDLAAARGITWARFFASLNWPDDQTNTASGWLGNRAEFFRRFDALVADARAAGIHLAPCILGNSFLWTDLAGEPRGQLFVPGSAGRLLFEQYVTDLVTRYKDDDTILFWEIGNELNLDADNFFFTGCNLADTDKTNDNGCHDTCARGAPCQRDARDNYYTCNACRNTPNDPQEDLGAFNHDIAALIHSIDPTRKVSSGLATIRPNGWHLQRTSTFPAGSGFWNIFDTPAQYAEALMQLHPDGVDLVSTHPYFATDSSRFGSTDVAGGDFVTLTHQIAVAHGKEVLVGEYGQFGTGKETCGPNLSKDCGGADASLDPSRRMSDIIIDQGIAYGSMFAYESAPLDPECPRDLSCGTSDASPIVAYIAALNQAGTVSSETPAMPTTLIVSWDWTKGAGLSDWSAGPSSATGSYGLVTLLIPRPPDPPGSITFLRVTADDFGCGGCLKSYALFSRPFPVVPGGGTITVSYAGLSTGPNAQINIHQVAASGEHLALAGVETSGTATNGVTTQLWPDATAVVIEVRVNDSASFINLENLVVTQGVRTDTWPPK